MVEIFLGATAFDLAESEGDGFFFGEFAGLDGDVLFLFDC